MEINKDTQLCMSLSARPSNFGTRFHNYLYKAYGLNFIYKAFRLEEDIEGAIRGIRALGIRGCAVSMPHKEKCIPFLNELSASAAAIQSVNTIVNDDNGFLRAYNTDYLAIQMLLNEHAASLPSSSSHMCFLLKGSGGMAKAAIAALRDAGYVNGCVIARNEGAGRALSEQYGFDWYASEEDALAATAADKSLMIVNCTPVGMAGSSDSESLAFLASTIDTAIVVFDVVAMPISTPMIAYARKCVDEGKDKIIIDGGEVVVRQALEQFVLYTGVRPEQKHVDDAAEHARKGL